MSSFILKYHEQGCELYAGSHHFGLPDFDCVVSESTDDAGLVILETVHPLTGLAATVDSLEGVASGPPVCFNSLKNVIKQNPQTQTIHEQNSKYGNLYKILEN